MRPPADCATMADLRVEIDRLDREIVDKLAARIAYIDRAVDLKRQEGLPARIEARVADVLSRVRAAAAGQGVDPALVETLWRSLIEWSIAREETALGRQRDGENGE